MRLQMLLMMRLMPLKSRLTVELRKRLQDNGPINKGLIYNGLINNGPILCDNGRKAPVFFKTRF